MPSVVSSTASGHGTRTDGSRRKTHASSSPSATVRSRHQGDDGSGRHHTLFWSRSARSGPPVHGLSAPPDATWRSQPGRTDGSPGAVHAGAPRGRCPSGRATNGRCRARVQGHRSSTREAETLGNVRPSRGVGAATRPRDRGVATGRGRSDLPAGGLALLARRADRVVLRVARSAPTSSRTARRWPRRSRRRAPRRPCGRSGRTGRGRRRRRRAALGVSTGVSAGAMAGAIVGAVVSTFTRSPRPCPSRAGCRPR